MKNDSLIIFTRIPKAGTTKTRLHTKLSDEECAEIQECFLKDIYEKFINLKDIDIVISYNPDGDLNILKNIFYDENLYIEQEGNNINEKMSDAINKVLSLGYSKCVLIGTDIPEINSDDIIDSFSRLDYDDFVFGPSVDGGYYLIGMKENNYAIFENNSGILADIIDFVKKNNFKYSVIDKKRDIDEYDDLMHLVERIRKKEIKLKNTEAFLKKIRLLN